MTRLIRLGHDGAMPPLVAVPGLDGSIGSIAPVVQALAEDRTVHVVDYTAEDNPTLDALSSEVAATIREALEGPIDMLGQSIGTIVTAQVATRLKERVRRVGLMGTFTRLNDVPLRLNNFFLSWTPDVLYRLVAPVAMAYVCGPVGDGRDHPFLDAVKSSSKGMIIKRTAWQIGRDFGEDLMNVPQPLLVLMGEKDRFVPDAGREVEKLTALLSGQQARVVPVAEGGHVFLTSAAIGRAVEELQAFFREETP